MNFYQRMGILPLKKRVNCDKCSFATKQRMFGVFTIDEILRYRGTRFPGSRTLCHPGYRCFWQLFDFLSRTTEANSMQKAAKYSKSTTDNVEQIKNIHVICRKDPFKRCVGCSRRKVVRGCLETVGHFSVVIRNSPRSLSWDVVFWTQFPSSGAVFLTETCATS